LFGDGYRPIAGGVRTRFAVILTFSPRACQSAPHPGSFDPPIMAERCDVALFSMASPLLVCVYSIASRAKGGEKAIKKQCYASVVGWVKGARRALPDSSEKCCEFASTALSKP
jgi:hypothetical protein